jgi:mediator of replication checkpoint protein 1
MDEESQDIVRDSQTQVSQVPESPLTGATSQAIHLHFSQSQIHGLDSMPQNSSATQFSEFPEPTQDTGFQAISPIKGRFVELPPSTIDTVILQQTPVPDPVNDSQMAKKKGKLRRRNEVAIVSDDEQGETTNSPAAQEIDEFEISENVFDVMRRASKRKETEVDSFDKKKSEAKEMVQEQAEESEDEYAGLGGASDDDSGGEEDAYVKEIIDDEGGKDADERQLAAFYAYEKLWPNSSIVTDLRHIVIKKGRAMRNK